MIFEENILSAWIDVNAEKKNWAWDRLNDQLMTNKNRNSVH